MEELYENLYGIKDVTIANEFLEKYLADTKPEYIKVFLFYLWKGCKENYTIEQTSLEIDLDENVVEMALKYWIKKKLMKKECLTMSEKRITSSKIEFDDIDKSKIVNLDDKKNELIRKNRKNYTEIENNLLFIAEKLIGKPLSERQVNLLEKCYNDYMFDEALISYLFEYCSNKGQTNAKYMSAVAISWYEQGFKDVESAKKFTENFENSGTKKKKNKLISNERKLDRDDDYNQMLIDSISKMGN